MQKWEYAEIALEERGMFGKKLKLLVYGGSAENKDYDPKQLNQLVVWLGDQGWELVSTTEFGEPTGYIRSRWIFKRLKETTST